MTFMTMKKSDSLFNSQRSPATGVVGAPNSGDFGLLRNKAFKIIGAVILVAILIAGGFYAYTRLASKSAASTTSETPLQTAEATKGNLVLYADGTGTVMPAEESSFGFNTSGQVSEVNVKVGDQVKAGQVLAQLDDTDAKIKLAEAQEAMNKLTTPAAIASATQTLAAAQSDFATAKLSLEYLISPEVLYWEEQVDGRGQTLADAQVTAQTETSDAAKQKVTEAQSALTYAQNQLKYFQTVYEETYVPKTFTQYRTRRGRGGIKTEVVKIVDEITGKKTDLIYPPSEGEIGMARSAYDLAKASIAEAQTYLDVLKGETIPEGATGANLVTYIQTKDALETAEYNLNATKLIAPFSGTVTALSINVGDTASGNEAITIANIDQPYALDAYLDAKDWGQVKVGYEVDVTFDIVPDQVFKGIVTNVYPTLDTTSSNSALVHITARLNEPVTYALPSGSAASVDVVGGRAENAVLVPVEALHEIEDGKYTLFVMEGEKLRLRTVEVGLQDLTKAEILSGLKPGDIVTTGVVKTK
jgi:multidrug efflux pump subunit AcrA (membrane-fusion protein)